MSVDTAPTSLPKFKFNENCLPIPITYFKQYHCGHNWMKSYNFYNKSLYIITHINEITL